MLKGGILLPRRTPLPLDPYTIIAYTACVLALMSLLFLVFWINGRRSHHLLWFVLPLAAATIGAGFLARPSLLPGLLPLQLGAWLILIAYGLTWQASRALYSRSLVFACVLVPSTLWLIFSLWIFAPYRLTEMSALIRGIIIAAFEALAAREFWLGRAERLPARAALFWIFTAYAAYAAGKVCLTAYLPMPLGGRPSKAWAIIVDNVSVVAQVLLTGAFVIVLLQERVASKYYRMTLDDPLTGVANRRAFEQFAESRASWDSSGRLSIMVLDIDRFKSINDSFGHGIGDEVIKLLARSATDIIGSRGTVFRMGGEEFACLLPGIAADAGYAIAEQVRIGFKARAAAVAACAVRGTVSIGVAESRHQQEALTAILQRADEALYQAKRDGRDRSRIARDPSRRRAALSPATEPRREA